MLLLYWILAFAIAWALAFTRRMPFCPPVFLAVLRERVVGGSSASIPIG